MSMNPKAPTRTRSIKPRADITIRDLGAEMVLQDEESGAFHILNGTARKIWLLLDGGTSDGEMQKRLISLFPEEDPAVLRGDLERTLEEFVRRKLVEGT